MKDKYPGIVYVLTGMFLIGAVGLFCMLTVQLALSLKLPNVKTEAIVTDIGQVTRKTKRHGRWVTTRTYSIEYTFEDNQGHEYCVSPMFTAGYVPYKEGSKVTLWYYDDNPNIWRTNYTTVMNVLSLVVIILFITVFNRLIFFPKDKEKHYEC